MNKNHLWADYCSWVNKEESSNQFNEAWKINMANKEAINYTPLAVVLWEIEKEARMRFWSKEESWFDVDRRLMKRYLQNFFGSR